MPDLQMFIPITKVDAAQRLVYGVATAEQVDRSGEICDYAGTKPLYEKWSGDIHKASDGKSLGNLRAMHGKVAAGKVTSIAFNDAAKQIEICAKVVDDGEWTKVTEGVYTGFSQGGSYVKRWKDDDGQQRYIADPVEVSLVDVPCLPSATFEMIKADGATEDRHFTSLQADIEPTNDQLAAKARDLAKVAGDETKWADHIEPARAALTKKTEAPKEAIEKADDKPSPVDGDEWEQVWKSKRDGATFKTKSELRKHHEDIDAGESVTKAAGPALIALDKIEAALGKKDYSAHERKEMAGKGTAMSDGSLPIASKADLDSAVSAYGGATNKAAEKRWIIKRAKALKATDVLPAEWPGSTKDTDKAAAAANLLKAVSLYGVANLLQVIACVEDAEQGFEQDIYWSGAVNVPDDLKTRFGAVVVELGDIAAEALDLVLSSKSTEESSEAMALMAPVVELMKAGARHSKTDKSTLQAAHDGLVKLGADCGTADKAVAVDDLAKNLTSTVDALTKMTAERDALEKGMGSITERLDEVLKRVKNIEEQPGPGPSGIFRVVGKTDDRAQPDAPAEDQIAKFLATEDGRQSLSTMLIKASQQNGRPLG
jgi:hypothetical protein